MIGNSGGIQYQLDLIQMPIRIPSDSSGIQLDYTLIKKFD